MVLLRREWLWIRSTGILVVLAGTERVYKIPLSLPVRLKYCGVSPLPTTATRIPR